jgi:hypothetical protein
LSEKCHNPTSDHFQFVSGTATLAARKLVAAVARRERWYFFKTPSRLTGNRQDRSDIGGKARHYEHCGKAHTQQ